MPLKTVLFDLDGTLLDTSEDLGGALIATLQQHQQPIPEKHLIKATVSDGASALLQLGFNHSLSDQDLVSLRAELLEHYKNNLYERTVVFNGIEHLISMLSENNLSWGIVTNKPKPYALPLMAHFHFASAPLCIICPEDVTHKKPHEEPLLLACQHAKCNANEAIYIGDHERDIQSAINAKMRSIAAGYGFVSNPEDALKWDADYTVNSATEIWPIIQSML